MLIHIDNKANVYNSVTLRQSKNRSIVACYWYSIYSHPLGQNIIETKLEVVIPRNFHYCILIIMPYIYSRSHGFSFIYKYLWEFSKVKNRIRCIFSYIDEERIFWGL